MKQTKKIITKLTCFFNTTQHYRNRLKKRMGKHYLFLFSKKTGIKHSYMEGQVCEEWKYKNFVWLTQNWKLRTFINKSLLD